MNSVIIFVSMHLPSNSVNEAGQKIAFQNLLEYSKKSKIHLISIVNENEQNFFDENSYAFCESAKFYKINNLNRILNLFLNIDLPFVIAIRNFYSIHKYINQLLLENPNALLHIEYEQGGIFIPNGHNNNEVVFHDIISQSLSRFIQLESNFFKKNWLQIQYKLLLNWEKNILQKINKKIVLNSKDKDMLINLGCIDKSIKVDYPVVSDIYTNAKQDLRVPTNILFWGAMNRFENEDAILWFYEKIYPRVIDKVPDLMLYIVGANPSKKVLELSSSNIIVTGYVDDPIKYFEISSISVVPLRFGAGIKIKVLEALAAGLEVVSTSVGSEGVVDDQGYLYTCDDINSFANTLITLIQEKKLLKNKENII